jgi:hypothetical protein
MTFKPMQDIHLSYQGYVSNVEQIETGSKLTIQIRQYDIANAHKQLEEGLKPQPTVKTYNVVSKKFVPDIFRSKSLLYEQGEFHTAQMTFYDAGLKTGPQPTFMYTNPHTIETELTQTLRIQTSPFQRVKNKVKSLVEMAQ